MSALALLLRREIALAWGRGGGPLLALGFYAAAVVMLPLALGPEPARLAAVAGGVAWVLLALSSLLSLERLFERDFEDGALDLLTLGPLPLEAVAAAKCLAQWLVAGAPLALAAPVAAVALGASPRLAGPLLLVSALGGLSFAFLGGTGAALALASRRGGLLIAVVVLPLLTPPVIFGGAALDRLALGMAWGPPLALLAAYAAATVALCPLAMAGACRNALS
ncbi:MAG: heme exporter protein CcmB [Alphaproteobacteria bacterium]|jgi:heme exporter protein B|nr:heme exporter protein CcmB [Alphaproteobacteria bacterium]